jgi:hypothetical protein
MKLNVPVSFISKSRLNQKLIGGAFSLVQLVEKRFIIDAFEWP